MSLQSRNTMRLCDTGTKLIMNIVTLSLLGHDSLAVPVDVAFQVDPTVSSLQLSASLTGHSDSSVQQISGTISASIDFGNAGVFAPISYPSILNSHLTSESDFFFSLTLNTVSITSATAAIISLSDPIEAAKVGDGAVIYEFPAESVVFNMNEGSVMSIGLTPAVVDLADQPISGAANASEQGELSASVISSTGPYVLISATLSLPIRVDSMLDLGNAELSLSGEGMIFGKATFIAALSPIPADFNDDLSVNGNDLTIWSHGFGQMNSTRRTGDATNDGIVDGADFLLWQRQLGLAPPQLEPSAVHVSEPWSFLLLAWGIASARSALQPLRSSGLSN